MSIILDGTNGLIVPQVNANIYISVGGAITARRYR